ncbi:MAG: bifunctional serine/threonine-protein kinase/formylglycine-generating enzyme family protein [Blastocatellia bacterium]
MAVEKVERIDKYEVLEQAGAGGMGAVYKALHPQFKKYVAIKEIRSELAGNPEIQRRFEREAELLAQLPAHPNIVTVRDALVWRGRLYLVMDYIEGGTLKDLVNGGGVAVRRCAAILDQILSGLEAIHSRGIVHRDLKSSNILIDREGTAHISDFGIAESVACLAKSSPMATPRYAAPESIEPVLARFGLEHQIDIYAAGMIAYEMLLGETGFRESFPDVYNGPPGRESDRWLNWHTDLARKAPNPTEIDPEIPRPLAALVERMVAKNVKERYRSASQARQDLAAWMPGADKSRGRRRDYPEDDATMPIDRARSSSASPGRPSPPRGGLLQKSLRGGGEPQYDSLPLSKEAAAAPTQKGVVGRFTKSRIIWAAALLLVVALALASATGGQPGFTLVVRNAPRGTVVYVDGKRVGVPTTEDTIRVFGLRAGAPLPIRLSYGGTECQLADNVSTVSGTDGQVQYVDAQCNSTTLPLEIDYGGQMVLVADQGEFLMGDNSHLEDERPQYSLAIPGYYIDKYEVTNEQYLRFCQDTKRSLPAHPWFEQYIRNNPRSPVIGISWNDAKAYSEWAKKRLPTEQEWEKAASWNPREKKKSQYPWGDKADPSLADLLTADPSLTNLSDQQPGTVLDFERDVSPYGVRGMAGGASEWVDAYYKAYKSESASMPDFGEKYRVVRGGSFVKPIQSARTTYRDHQLPDEKARVGFRTAIGFRCAISANDPRLRDPEIKQYLREHGLSK